MSNQNIWNQLTDYLRLIGREERLIIGFVALASLIAISVYAVRKVRRGIEQANPTISDHLTDFRRMRDEGEINEKEFNRVMTSVSDQALNKTALQIKEPPILPESSESPHQGA